MQENSESDNILEIINFVWVGPPKINHGGMDVIGPETIAANFKQFTKQNTASNPIKFWCQKEYKDTYKQYFNSMNIQVLSIEDYLHTYSGEFSTQAKYILDNYYSRRLRNKDVVKDYVFLKNMFFAFILATEGGYVLDTDIQANNQQQVSFTTLSCFMFPILMHNQEIIDPEIWMLYAPKKDLTVAKKYLKSLISSYLSQAMQDAVEDARIARGARGFKALAKYWFSRYLPNTAEKYLIVDSHSKVTQQTGGELAVHIIRELQSNKDFSVAPLKVRYDGGAFIHIAEMGLVKEYCNTHKTIDPSPNIPNWQYSQPHTYAALGCIDKLVYALQHGVDANAIAPQVYSNYRPLEFEPEISDEINKTILHVAVQKFQSTDHHLYAHIPLIFNQHKYCIVLLLKNGADPNLASTKTYRKQTTTESPLTLAIKNEYSVILLQLLFDNTTTEKPIKLDKILDNQSPLMVAIDNSMHCCKIDTIEFLLQHGADPNQSWRGQISNPLTLALNLASTSCLMYYKYKPIIHLLRSYGAQPFDSLDTVTKPIGLLYGTSYASINSILSFDMPSLYTTNDAVESETLVTQQENQSIAAKDVFFLPKNFVYPEVVEYPNTLGIS